MICFTAVFKSVVDGATNELYNCFPDHREKYIPDVISGDFDSAKQEYIDWYENLVRLKSKGHEFLPNQLYV